VADPDKDSLPAAVEDRAVVDILPVAVEEEGNRAAAVKDSPPVAVKDTLPAVVQDSPPVVVEDSLPVAVEDTLPVAVEDSLPVVEEDSRPVAVEDSLGNRAAELGRGATSRN